MDRCIGERNVHNILLHVAWIQYLLRPRQFGEAGEEHDDEDDDGHDFVDAETETNETSSLSEASPLVEDRPIVKLRAVAEHDFTSDNPKVMTTFLMAFLLKLEFAAPLVEG